MQQRKEGMQQRKEGMQQRKQCMQPAGMLVRMIGNSPWDDFGAVGSALLGTVVPAEGKTGQNKTLEASCKGIKQAVDCAIEWNRQTQHPDPSHCIIGYS